MSASVSTPQVEYGADEVSALVLDPGYSVVRAGFAGEDAPKSIVPTYYGRKTGDGAPLFGENTVHNPFAGLEISNPMNSDGTVEDWDVASKLWEYTITSRLTGQKATSPLRNGLNDEPKGEDGDVTMDDVEQNEKPMAESPLIVTEPGWNPTKNREKIMEIAFEEWGVPAFFLARSGVMAAFASGKPSSLVIDIGASNTAVTPVYDGLMLKKGALHSPIAGDFVSDQIRLFFNQTTPPTPLTPHYLIASKTPVEPAQPAQATYQMFPNVPPSTSFRRLQEERVLTEFKESVVQVWDPAKMSGQPLSQAMDYLRQNDRDPRAFEMPDGWNNVFGPERHRPAEGLFDEKAALSGDPGTGRPMATPTDKTTIPALCKAALAAVDTDSKGNLLNNVVVVGGTSLLPQMTNRINTELTNQWPSMKVRIQAPGNIVERKYASWVGGSILASLGTFHQMWISKKEYEEGGSSVVEKRCK